MEKRIETEQPQSRGTVLVLDDEVEVLATMRRQLHRDFEVLTAPDIDEAYRLLAARRVDVVISDQRMPKGSGNEFLREVLHRYPDTVRILLTGYADLEAVVDAVNHGGIYGYITKPWNAMEVRTTIDRAVTQNQLRRKNLELLGQLQAAKVELEEKIEQRTQALRESEARSRLLLESAGEGIFGFDRDGLTTFANPVAMKALGFSQAELVGVDIHALIHHSRVDGSHYPAQECRMLEVINSGEAQHVSDEVFWRKDGSSIEVEYVSAPLRSNGDIDGAVVVFSDVTERMGLERQLVYQATHDLLTGLYNRQYFHDALAGERQRAQRFDQPFALIMLDIDHFKPINDQHGHDVGDEVLKSVTTVLEESFRDVDTLARWGGEEFVALLPGSNSRSAAAVAERCREAVATTAYPPVGEVTVSLGVTEYEAGESLSELLKRADDALYRAKEAGRNRVECLTADPG